VKTKSGPWINTSDFIALAVQIEKCPLDYHGTMVEVPHRTMQRTGASRLARGKTRRSSAAGSSRWCQAYSGVPGKMIPLRVLIVPDKFKRTLSAASKRYDC
jgi:hypothetical protein